MVGIMCVGTSTAKGATPCSIPSMHDTYTRVSDRSMQQEANLPKHSLTRAVYSCDSEDFPGWFQQRRFFHGQCNYVAVACLSHICMPLSP